MFRKRTSIVFSTCWGSVMVEGHRRFIELAIAIGDKTTLNRIERGIHPFRDEFIDRKDWPLPEVLA